MVQSLMEELHPDSIDGGHEGQLWARSRARERAYSNNNIWLRLSLFFLLSYGIIRLFFPVYGIAMSP